MVRPRNPPRSPSGPQEGRGRTSPAIPGQCPWRGARRELRPADCVSRRPPRAPAPPRLREQTTPRPVRRWGRSDTAREERGRATAARARGETAAAPAFPQQPVQRLQPEGPDCLRPGRVSGGAGEWEGGSGPGGAGRGTDCDARPRRLGGCEGLGVGGGRWSGPLLAPLLRGGAHLPPAPPASAAGRRGRCRRTTAPPPPIGWQGGARMRGPCAWRRPPGAEGKGRSGICK